MSLSPIDVLNALFRKKEIHGDPPMFVVHRFLASDRDFAPFVRDISRDVRDDQLAFAIWQAALPKTRTAPFLPYAAAKKLPAAGDLAARIMERKQMSRTEAEEALGILELAGHIPEVRRFFGLEEEV